MTHWLVKLFLILVGGFQLMLWFGSALCFIVYGLSGGEDVQTLALAIVLVAVVLLTSFFQFYQVRPHLLRQTHFSPLNHPLTLCVPSRFNLTGRQV